MTLAHDFNTRVRRVLPALAVLAPACAVALFQWLGGPGPGRSLAATGDANTATARLAPMQPSLLDAVRGPETVATPIDTGGPAGVGPAPGTQPPPVAPGFTAITPPRLKLTPEQIAAGHWLARRAGPVPGTLRSPMFYADLGR